MGTLALAITLVVRLYDNGVLGDADRSGVIAAVSEILLASDIPTSWPECAPAGRTGPVDPAPLVCDRPMRANEVAVRLVSHAPNQLVTRPSSLVTRSSSLVTRPSSFVTPRDLPLGYSLIDPVQHSGALATIYLDRVEWIAADAGINPRIVLARAIAHEIGHLVLGTNDHSPRGLMRAIWSRQTLERNLASDWLFTGQDAAAMQRGLGRRAPVTQQAETIAWGTR